LKAHVETQIAPGAQFRGGGEARAAANRSNGAAAPPAASPVPVAFLTKLPPTHHLFISKME